MSQRGEGDSTKKPRRPKYDKAKSDNTSATMLPSGHKHSRRRETRFRK